MTVRYYLRSKKKNAGIYVSVSLPGDIKYRKKTGLLVDPKTWSVKKQLPDNSTVANKNLGFKLTKLKNRIIESYNEVMSDNGTVDENWLDSLLFGKKKGNTVLWSTEFLLENAHRIKSQKGKVGLSKGRVRIYEVFKRKLEEYNPDWRISDVNLKEVEKFKDWLYGKGYSDNYVSSFVSRLRAVCNYSEQELHPEFKKIKTFEKPKENIMILTNEDQDKIKGLKLVGDLEAVKKWTLLGCQLGQRGSDLLAMDEYQMINGVRIIYVEQQKTGKKVAVPVNDKAWEVLKDGFPEPLKLYKFNELIKIVCRRAKVNRYKEASSHVLRRSFATNYYGKIPTPILMSITGHSKESTFLAYVGKTSLDNAFEAAEWFKRLGNI